LFSIVKVPVSVKTEDDVITCASSLTTRNIIPIFTVSCVTGEGLDLFYKFLYVLPPSMNIRDRERLVQSDSEFQVCF
jgi:elongation factor 1-alpha